MIGNLEGSVPAPLVELANRVDAKFGAWVRIVELPYGDDEPGLHFVPTRSTAAELMIVFAAGVYSVFFENYTTESTDFPKEDPADWALKLITSVALNGVIEREEPWAWGFLRGNAIYFGASPEPLKYSAVVRQFDPWVPGDAGL